MKLIDVDALPKDWKMTRILVSECPTVDAVPVIRCKDCIYKNEYGYCTLYINFHHLTADMDYCSDGERKEE